MTEQNKEELRKQHEELARGLAEINNPLSYQDVLRRQTIADYKSQRNPKDFFKK